MDIAKYLLSIEEFMDRKKGEALLARAFSYVDEERAKKAGRMRSRRAQAASLGAGLLLQAAVREASAAGPNRIEEIGRELPEDKAEWEEGNSAWTRYGVSDLLDVLQGKPPLPLAYAYGREGKPYFRDLPLYFNLSHSGDYVLCAVSAEEVGADIQQHVPRGHEGLAERFFSKRECAALEQAGEEREALFYRLWARKEAYGKLTGKGVAGVLDMDMLSERDREGGESFPGGEGVFENDLAHLCKNRIFWEEYRGLEGYSIAVCRYREAKTADYPS